MFNTRMINPSSLQVFADAIKPVEGFYAIFLHDKGIDATSKQGLEAIAAFRETLMNNTIKDAELAFQGLKVSDQDLYTINDIGYDNWLKDREVSNNAEQ